MLSRNTRTVQRQLAVLRGSVGNNRLFRRHIWGVSHSSSQKNENEESLSSADATPESSQESKYSKLLDFIDEEAINERQHPGFSRRVLSRNFKNTPIFTSAVEKFVQSELPPGKQTSDIVPQYGLIGVRQDDDGASMPPEDRLIMGNVNMPWSAFICGSQGAGKSHTLCCLLENALVANHDAGKLPNPLAGLVMHYDSHSSQSTTQLCEAAYLCSSGIPVNVLVSPSNIWAMKRLYNNLPGLPPGSPRPKVLPLYLEDNQLDVSKILKLMAVDPASDDTPLYMELVMSLVRKMAMEGEKFTYSNFIERLGETGWMSGQRAPLNLRLELLDSFMAPSHLTMSTRPAKSKEDIWAFEPGSLTIIDLSDPFISSDEACTIFTICLSLFLEQRNKCGRIVALDEAHKFLSKSGEARVLTEELVSVIRQQRHTGTRVAIATQEPTLSPQLIALANATFVHRFLSPNWYEVLKQHLAGANREDPGHKNTLFRKIVALRTGQALLFCPTAQMDIDDESPDATRSPRPLNDNYVNIRVRKRMTADGGKSIMAADVHANSVPDEEPEEVPMFVVDGAAKANKTGGANKNGERIRDKEDIKEARETLMSMREELDAAVGDKVHKNDNPEQSAEEPPQSIVDMGTPRVMAVLQNSKSPPSSDLLEALETPITNWSSPSLKRVLEVAMLDAESMGWKSFSSRSKKEKHNFMRFSLAGLGVNLDHIGRQKSLKNHFAHFLDKHLKGLRVAKHQQSMRKFELMLEKINKNKSAGSKAATKEKVREAKEDAEPKKSEKDPSMDEGAQQSEVEVMEEVTGDAEIEPEVKEEADEKDAVKTGEEEYDSKIENESKEEEEPLAEEEEPKTAEEPEVEEEKAEEEKGKGQN